MMDFSNALMHCSTIAYFMYEGRCKTPKQIYEDTIQSRDAWQAKYDGMTERLQGMKSGLKALAKVDELNAKIKELEPIKDELPLSKTAKSYLKKYYAYLKYGKWSAALDKGNKYTAKGNLAEGVSIDLLSKLDGVPLVKNEIRIQNDFLTGIPDTFIGESVFQAEYVYDTKTSWDIETFIDNLGKDLNPIYWWQMQGYLALTGAQRGEVSYCLVNTPEVLLEGEKYALLRRYDVVTEEAPEFKVAYKELLNNMTFDDMPIQDRRLKFIVERDEEAIQRVYKRVEKCREYMSEIQELHSIGVFNAKQTNQEENLEDNGEETIFDAA
jgi:hypothetical protein